MGEIKSVKVDNWGVFFLQKLQNFFNKTDYCDLTLQFRDNSQLKVHRLVLSACTDYFNVLEQTCEVIDDALIMPNELQADVVVPIVNFMYTGTLEFELKMYGKLLRTAKEMNMTVLLKLLEAHRRTMENVNRAQRPPSPKAIRRRVPIITQTTTTTPVYQNQAAQQRRILTTNVAGGVGGNVNAVQRRVVQTKSTSTNVSPVQIQYRQQIGSTSVVRTVVRGNNATNQQQTVQTFIKNEPEEFESYGAGQAQTSNSPFEQLRKGYNNNKRPAISTFLSPPTKKPNLEDVKEFAEQQRMRKQIAAEYGEDHEFEGMMDDDIHNDDDDDDGNPTHSSTMTHTASGGNVSAAATQATSSSVPAATITFKHEGDNQPPTIIVKDNSGSKMDHAKIISEVLRQYPHLAKGNKNIKLKIMPTGQGQAQRITIKKEGGAPEQPQIVKQQIIQKANQQQTTVRSGQQVTKTVAVQQTQAVAQATEAKAPVAKNAAAESVQQKRRIDSKTMHALIAMGAENMNGPWLCLRCGVNGRPISIPSYRGFRRHLINTHKETIDPALCEHCGWRSQNNRELHFHVQIEHKIKTTLYTFPECLLCAELFLDTNALNQHMLDSHPSANKQQCVYCNKIFVKDMQLYTHLKLYHKHQAVDDGIIDASEEEYAGSQQGEEMETGMEEHLESEQQEQPHEDEARNKDKKVKILSDISLPLTSSIIKLDGNTLTANTSGVIDAQTKFVTPDGNEMLLTEEQRKEIMSQLNQEHNNGGVVMVLNDAIFTSGDAEAVAGTNAAAAEAESQEQVGDEDVAAAGNASEESEFDDSQIYAELASEKNEREKQQHQQKQEQQAEEAKEADESLKWAENLISEHDTSENENEGGGGVTKEKTEEDKAKKELISKKLKELTVDWSEDENEDDDEDLDKSGLTEDSEKSKEFEKLDEKNNDDDETDAHNESNEGAIEKLEDEIEQTDSQDTSLEQKEQAASELNEENIEEEEEKEQMEEQDDEIELAMKNLHDEQPKELEKPTTTTTTTTEVTELTKENPEAEEMDVDEHEIEKPIEETDKQQQQQTEEQTTVENTENSLSTALLDELMSATVGQSTDSMDLQQVLKEDDAEAEETPTASKLNESLETLVKDEQSDVEEFVAIESNEKVGKTTTTTEASNEATTKENVETTNKNEEHETQAVEESKQISTDEWQNIEDDDDMGLKNDKVH